MKSTYDRDADALYISFGEAADVARSVEIDPGTLVDIDRFGHLVGVEVLHPAREWPLSDIAAACKVTAEQLELLTAQMGGSAEGHRPFAFA